MLATVIRDIDDGAYETKQRQREVTHFEICDDFMAYSKAHKRSWDKDERSVEKLKSFLGDLPCKQITRFSIEHFIALRREGTGVFKKPVKPAAINRELACLRTTFNRALQDEKIAKNPMVKIKLLSEDNVRDRVLSEEEYQRLLFSAPKHLRPVLITARETGMRRGEILNLRWNQVDLSSGVIKLTGEETKTGKGRVIPISPVLKNALNKIHRVSEYVFTYKGKQLRDVRTGFTVALEKANIVDFRFHDIRHCFVTRMRRKGIPDRVVMAITGHQTLECFRRYDTISIDDIKDAIG